MKLRYVQALFSAAAIVLAPGAAMALGGSNAAAPAGTGSTPGNAASAGPATTGAPQGLDLSSVAACTTAPADGVELVCSCAPDARTGSVWGTGPFTGDSDICTAARFTGAIGAEGGVVRLTGLPGQSAYEGGTANGVTTRSWGGYGRSFVVEPVGAPAGGPTEAQIQTAAGSDLEQCSRLPPGVDSYACSCQANAAEAKGSVWGADPFTTDSSICAAALLTGYISAGQPASVRVLRIQGLEKYTGTTQNGVTSNSWGRYGSSFVFDWNQ